MLRDQPFFLNCSSAESLCEVSDGFLLGRAGVCNATTQRCVCPDGFDGKDLFAEWNDCHIHVQMKMGFEYAAIAFAALCCAVSLFGIFRLLFDWGIIYWGPAEPNEFVTHTSKVDNHVDAAASPKIVMSTESLPLATDLTLSPSSPKRRNTLQSMLPNLDIGELQTPRTNARTNAFQQMVMERKRRRNTLTLIVIWFVFSIFAIIFQVYRIIGYRLEFAQPVMMFCLAGMMASAPIGLWMMTYTWFSNFPSLRNFAAMFPAIRGSILVQHPNFLRAFLIVNCVLISVNAYVFAFILPVVDARFVSQTLYTTIVVILAVEIAVFALTHASVCLFLLKLFNALRAMKNPSNSGEKNLRASKGRTTVIFILGLTLVFGPFFCAWNFVMAFLPIGIRYSFFFLSGLFIGGSAVGLVSVYVFVFRMGPKTQARKGSSSNSPRMTIHSKKSNKRLSMPGELQLSPVNE